MKEKERFSGIKRLTGWLFRERRTSNVSPATELETPRTSQSLLDAIRQFSERQEAHPKVPTEVPSLVPKNLTGKEKRNLRILLYKSEPEEGRNSDRPKKQWKRAKEGQSQNGPSSGEQEHKEGISPERREIVVETDAPSNLSRKSKKEKKHQLSVRELTKYAKENGFEVTGESDGHIRLAHKDGWKIGYNKRPNTLSPGLYADVMKTIEKSKDRINSKG